MVIYFCIIILSKSVMSIFYSEEHKTCYNYNVPELSVFKYFKLDKDSPPVFMEMERSMLCFVARGDVVVRLGRQRTQVISGRTFFLVPSGSNFFGWQHSHAELMCCSFVDTPKFCNIYTIENLAKEMGEVVDAGEEFVTLPICDRLHQFLCLLGDCMDDGILCAHFHQLMLQELFLLLRGYYSKHDLARMFVPILGFDNGFRGLVLKHYKDFADIKQFAELANMTPSTFQRKFKQEFKKSVNEWLLDRKCELIIRDIKTSPKTINEISDEYGFSSMQYFSTFCKRHFGKTPTELRAEPFE